MTRQVDIKALVSHIVRGDGADRCRICMGDTSEGQVHLEDTVMMDGEKPVTLAELLEIITGVEVERTPPLPNKLCGQCKNDLTSMIPFINLCRNSAKRWSEISDYLFKFNVSNKTKNAYIRIGKDINTLTDTTRCSSDKIRNRKEALKRYKIRLHRHMHYKTRTEKNSTTTENKMKCPECRALFFDLFKFNKHIGNMKKKMCGECRQIIDKTKYVKHAKTHNLNVFSCPICFESFEKEKAYYSHEMKHENGTVVCIDCHMPFTNVSYLNSHMHKHKPVNCGCGKWLPNRTCFFNHKKICVQHKNIKPKFVCDYCSKAYNKKNVLRMHIKHNHTVGSLFQCDRCGKKFNNRTHLIEHGNTHDKILDRFVCVCGAKFSTRRGYQRHSKMHENAKTFAGRKKILAVVKTLVIK